MKQFTREEVSQHCTNDDCWIIINGEVFDVTKFLKFHPGGRAVLAQYAGKDATSAFVVYHNDDVLRKYREKFLIGEVHPPLPEKPRPAGTFGDMIPYGDPLWYQRFRSPYYKDTHIAWRAKVRAFVDAEIIPSLEKWKRNSTPPQDIYLKMGEQGFLAAMVGPPWPAKFLPSHIQPPADFDSFHELILYDEIARCGHAPSIGAITNGPAIALSAVAKFGTPQLQERIAPNVLLGREYIALAISEPQAGSDVAGLVTTAKRVGNKYIVTGNKKWITNGTYAHYFVTAVRTGGPGYGGISFLLIDRDTPGFTIRKLNIRDSDVSGTAYLDFDNCEVPTENLIGRENEGFKLIMYNFNHERFYICVLATRMARICLEESIKYALRRETFGKSLSQHQAIRMKIAAMIRRVEAMQAWLESVTYQMCVMGPKEANLNLGDVISLLKAEASKVYEYCARESVQIFGGNALYIDGVGRKIEPAGMQVKGYQIPAGAEDVMDDFGARSAFKRAAAFAKL